MQATITAKGQITLPKTLREQLHLDSGDKVEFIIQSDGSVRMLPRSSSVTHLKGILPKPTQPVSLEAMDEAIADAVSATFIVSTFQRRNDKKLINQRSK